MILAGAGQHTFHSIPVSSPFRSDRFALAFALALALLLVFARVFAPRPNAPEWEWIPLASVRPTGDVIMCHAQEHTHTAHLVSEQAAWFSRCRRRRRFEGRQSIRISIRSGPLVEDISSGRRRLAALINIFGAARSVPRALSEFPEWVWGAFYGQWTLASGRQKYLELARRRTSSGELGRDEEARAREKSARGSRMDKLFLGAT